VKREQLFNTVTPNCHVINSICVTMLSSLILSPCFLQNKS